MDGFSEHSLQMCADSFPHQAELPSQRSFSPVSKDIIVARDDWERRRLQTIQSLGLIQTEPVTVFDEATQNVARFLSASICFLGIMERDRLWLRSAIGLSNKENTQHLASVQQIPRHESFCNHVIQSGRPLVIEDTHAVSDYQRLALVSLYGMRAYLGVPLITSSGDCVGTLAVMEQQACIFDDKDVSFLEAIARWCMSEFERHHLAVRLSSSPDSPFHDSSETVTSRQSSKTTKTDSRNKLNSTTSNNNSVRRLCWFKANLIGHMVQELQTPLTSILGMTSVLTREIYGPLTDKQKEYMGIVHGSGQHLHSLVNEITDLDELDGQPQINLSPVDIEMLCQQALSVLDQASKQRSQNLRLSIEPGHRIWLLDKIKVRQILYHLVFRVIQVSNPDSVVRVHISRKDQQLNIAIWISHPWLGEGLPHSEFCAYQDLLHRENRESGKTLPPAHAELIGQSTADSLPLDSDSHSNDKTGRATLTEIDQLPSSSSNSLPSWDIGGMSDETGTTPTLDDGETVRHNLGLLLSQALVELHGGSISLQGSPESGYRYVVAIPQMQTKNELDD